MRPYIDRERLKKYVATLEQKQQALWTEADSFCNETEDTLCEEFQVCAEICEVFMLRAMFYWDQRECEDRKQPSSAASTGSTTAAK